MQDVIDEHYSEAHENSSEDLDLDRDGLASGSYPEFWQK
jgi:hypothetical protein